MKEAFKRIALDPYFDLFITAKELGAKKPEPAFFMNALHRLGIKANEALMVGNDYGKDITPAKAIHMATVLITDKDGNYPMRIM